MGESIITFGKAKLITLRSNSSRRLVGSSLSRSEIITPAKRTVEDAGPYNEKRKDPNREGKTSGICSDPFLIEFVSDQRGIEFINGFSFFVFGLA